MDAETIFGDPRGHRIMFRDFYLKMNEWGNRNKRFLTNLSVVPACLDEIKRLHAEWLDSLISDYYSVWGQMRTFGNIRASPAVHIFTELSRSHFLIMYQQLLRENEWTVKEGRPNPEHLISFCMQQTEYFETTVRMEDWERPIMMYTQRQVMDLLLLLTEKLDQLPYAAEKELERILEALYTRNSVFLCETTTKEVLNVEGMTTTAEGGCHHPNRHYLTFCTIYFHAIQRRLHHLHQIRRLELTLPEGTELRVEKWVQELTEALGPEGFDDCYSKACEEAYNFPGDREWFKYRYPDQPAQTGPILDCFRKDFAKRYFTEYRITKESVLAAVNQTSHTGQCARIYVLNAVDQYMKTHLKVPWRDGLVIENGVIESSQVKLYRSQAPYFLQLFSRYWVYDDSAVYPCDDIYKSLGIWLYLCKTRYKSSVFGISIAPLIDRIVSNAQTKKFHASF